MRTSIESCLLNALFVALFVVWGGRGVSGTYTWSDCGDPLSKLVTYQSLTLSEDPVVTSSNLLVNVAFNIKAGRIWAGNILQVTYNGGVVLNTSTTDVCDLPNTVLNCPFNGGTYSYTSIYAVPSLPSGTYNVKITNIFGQGVFQTNIGCVEFTVQVDNPQVETCSYVSTATADISLVPTFPGGNLWNDRTTVFVGSNWGPQSAGAPYGTFSSVTASPDLLIPNSGATSGTFSDIEDLFWAASGSLSAVINGSSTTSYQYSGVFFVGYNGTAYPKLLSLDNSLLSGNFEWTFAVSGNTVQSISGLFQILPALGTQPTGWPYPLGFGRLDNFTFQSGPTGYAVTSSRTYDTCVSGIPSNLQSGTSSTSSGLTNAQKWSIGLGVAGFLLVIGIIVLLFMAWRENRDKQYLNDDDLVDPLKPDYGFLAINDIIEGGDELPPQ